VLFRLAEDQRIVYKKLHADMKTSDGFLAYVLDQLQDIDEVVSRPMFGGTGLYAGTVFFGIVYRDVLYFKVDDRTRPDYERAGMKPFRTRRLVRRR
jgi:DNA transformation protein and related proteins